MSDLKKIFGIIDEEIERLEGSNQAENSKDNLKEFMIYDGQGRWQTAEHLDLITSKLQEVSEDTVEGIPHRLIITLPPRHGKSETVSKKFPAWHLGRNPEHEIILSSYSADLAYDHSRIARDTLVTHSELFDVNIAKDSAAVGRWGLEGHRGGLFAVGVGGPITGRGAHIGIIDDPFKNAEEANSETIREKVWNWYTTTFYTRLAPGGSIIILMTRWHEDDLVGRLLAKEKEDIEKGLDVIPWEVINLPAIADEDDPLGRLPGEALWPERFPINVLKETRRTLGSYWFEALYQQRPAPAEGNKFKRQWFKYFEERDSYYILHTPEGKKTIMKEDCWRFQTADTASSEKQSADYTVLTDWVVTPDNDLLVDDVFRDRIEVPEQEKIFQSRYYEKNPSFQAIETKNTGIALRQYLIRKGLPIKELKADTDKVTRAATIMVMYENGKVYHRKGAAWLEEWEDELITFPTGKHDDQVDTASYAGIIVTQIKPYKEKKSRPKGVRRRR